MLSSDDRCGRRGETSSRGPVIAAADSRFGETPAAIITVADGAALDESAVVEHCVGILADYKVPRYVVLRHDALPRLPSGKLDKKAIQAQYPDIPERFTKVR